MFKYGGIQGHDSSPGPQLPIQILSGAEHQWSREVGAIIDTGASKTCVPQWVIKELESVASPVYGTTKAAKMASGEVVQLKSYYIDIKVACCVFLYMEVLAIDNEYALIGRDILNSYVLTLDGPNRQWQVKK